MTVGLPVNSNECSSSRTPASQNGVKSANDWMASELKPSSPFKPRPSTTDAKVEGVFFTFV